MSAHSIIQYLKYRRKAKSRHGIHSPFVYAFVEHGLMKGQGDTLLQKIEHYFSGHELVELNIDMPETCIAEINKAKTGSILIVHNIHRSKTATENWDKIKKLTAIKLSTDLYSLGMLFFNSEVKEQQHFVLKYPL